jgi:IS5 family transposase
MGRYNKALGEEGVDELLARTIYVSVTWKVIVSKEPRRIIVDSTVQEKAVAHSTDSKLLDTASVNLVVAAKVEGIGLKQTYAKEAQLLGYNVTSFVMPTSSNACAR